MIRSTAILLLAFTGSAFAQDLDYTYIQASYDFVDIDELDIDGLKPVDTAPAESDCLDLIS